jgi:hypothetical protein
MLAITVTTLEPAAQRQAEEQLHRNLRLAWQLVRGDSGAVRLVDRRLRVGATMLDGDTAIVDRVQALVGGVATIFRATTRVATNVRTADGSRAIGTKPARVPPTTPWSAAMRATAASPPSSARRISRSTIRSSPPRAS